MSTIELDVINKSFYTDRKDKWRQGWFLFGFTFVAFVFYSLWAVFLDFEHGVHGVVAGTNYTSPFYGPELIENVPYGLPFAVLTLWAPFGFRGTCYYMRRVYYRSIFNSPPACAVEGFEHRRGKYDGETKLFYLNSYHRLFLYVAILLGLFHWYEVFNAFQFGGRLYIGVGSVLAFLDAFFLSLYILSCHAFRNLIGGGSRRMSMFKFKIWSKISVLNEKHGLYFWLSMFSIWAYDLYIRLVAWGVLKEIGWLF